MTTSDYQEKMGKMRVYDRISCVVIYMYNVRWEHGMVHVRISRVGIGIFKSVVHHLVNVVPYVCNADLKIYFTLESLQPWFVRVNFGFHLII